MIITKSLQQSIKSTKEYFKLLPLADNIYSQLYGKPKTHEEWAESFNKKGIIINELRKTKI